MDGTDTSPETGAEALLLALGDCGVSCLFANAGTDFPPLIEGYARLPATRVPQPVTVPHETVAVGMAHGYWLVTGAPQAVMVHVNVGLANAAMGVINAASDNVPMLVLSGRTPLTETGHFGGRMTPIQHGQEMFDQTGIVRGAVKYEYEVRYPEQCDSVLRRAAAICRSDPAGPVYVSLPREPFGARLPEGFAPAPVQVAARPAAPDAEAITTLADWLAEASMPGILCQRGDPDGRLGALLPDIAERVGARVCEPFPIRNVMATDHPAFTGHDAAAALDGADLVIALDSGVPWIEALSPPAARARVVHIGPDPLFGQRPVRGFRSDLSITADPVRALQALARAVADQPPRAALGPPRARSEPSPPAAGQAMSPAWFSKCISDVMDEDAVVFSELGLMPGAMTFRGPNRFFGSPHAGGLGWGLPAALGAQLADRDRLVIAAIGDGSYMFANPVACHQVAEALGLPVLIVVKNNAMWNAVRRAVVKSYPDGAASRLNEIPLTSLAPLPDFAAIARAARAHAERVEDGAALPGALRRAVEVIRSERRHALIDVRVAATDTL
jgi:acetolactate synthase-1/2/3 large subunit